MKQKPMQNLREVNNSFVEIERQLDLFRRQIRGCFYWDYLRYPCYQKAVEHHGLFSPSPEQTPLGRLSARCKEMANLARFSLVKNCFMAPQADYVFFGHPRRKLETDGLYWDIYCDPIVESLPEPYVLLERPFAHGP
ncbi:MAG: hypothetical protein OEU36_24910, partial [Gammaproteobacteria bacterium]|nr:hypothetical protein [Gammaproteobacteria bacterium]